ncbi:MAG: hypothetical protein QFX35_05730 [Candidatus Verstraetearchaeota archaeon]|nr:hypothetical protein [Candidatus Verstraetearchaeota archaeon]
MGLTFGEVLEGGRGSTVNATVSWRVAYYNTGPPPVVAEILRGSSRGAFFEELVKLSDIRLRADARAILISPRRAIGVEKVRLASSFGVYVVLDTDPDGLSLASSGADVGEVNSRAISAILGSRNRKVASECRAAILALLEERWLTLEELISSLSFSFSARTVSQQLRSLTRSGSVRVLGRTKGGYGVFGIPGRVYPLRGDLSRPSTLRHLSGAVIAVLASSGRALSSGEISESLNASKHQVRRLLRRLSNEGKVERTEIGWALKK